MNRRGFFAKFAAIAAAVPFVGKLVRRRMRYQGEYVFAYAPYSGHRDMILHVRNFDAKDYCGTWKWELTEPEAIIRIDT